MLPCVYVKKKSTLSSSEMCVCVCIYIYISPLLLAIVAFIVALVLLL